MADEFNDAADLATAADAAPADNWAGFGPQDWVSTGYTAPGGVVLHAPAKNGGDDVLSSFSNVLGGGSDAVANVSQVYKGLNNLINPPKNSPSAIAPAVQPAAAVASSFPTKTVMIVGGVVLALAVVFFVVKK